MSTLRAAIAALSMLALAPAASAGTWTIGRGAGECWNTESRAGGAKYCHNCKNQNGTRVRWTFERKCDGAVHGEVVVSLACGRAVPKEGAQLRALQALAKAELPSAEKACPGGGTPTTTGTGSGKKKKPPPKKKKKKSED